MSKLDWPGVLSPATDGLDRGRALETAVEALLAHDRAVRQGSEAAWASLGLSCSELKALVLIDLSGRLSISQVATQLKLGRPRASIVAESLVRQGLVSRAEDPGDRRRSLVELTDAGRDLIADLFGMNEQSWRRRCGDLSTDELLALSTILGAITDLLASKQKARAGRE